MRSLRRSLIAGSPPHRPRVQSFPCSARRKRCGRTSIRDRLPSAFRTTTIAMSSSTTAWSTITVWMRSRMVSLDRPAQLESTSERAVSFLDAEVLSFDEPVGVGDDRVARRQIDHDVVGAGSGNSRVGAGNADLLDAAVGSGEERHRMPREAQRDAQPVGVGAQTHLAGGTESLARHPFRLRQGVVERRQDGARAGLVASQRADRVGGQPSAAAPGPFPETSPIAMPQVPSPCGNTS